MGREVRPPTMKTSKTDLEIFTGISSCFLDVHHEESRSNFKNLLKQRKNDQEMNSFINHIV